MCGKRQMGEGTPSITVIIRFYLALSARFPFLVPLRVFFPASPSAVLSLCLYHFPLPEPLSLWLPAPLLTFAFLCERLVLYS